MESLETSDSQVVAPSLLSVPPLSHALRRQQFDTIDALMAEYREFAKEAGYGVRLTQACNAQRMNGQRIPGTYTRYTLVCELDTIRDSTSSGLRTARTRKQNCPFKLFAKCPASIGKWVIDFESPRCVLTHEGHDPLPASHIKAFRGLHSEAKEIINIHADNPTVRNRTLVEVLRNQYPELNFAPQDVKNARARARLAQLGPYTHTQAMFKLLEEKEGTDFTVKWKDNVAENGIMEGIYITHRFGDRMIKNHPYTVMFDNTYKTNKFGLAFFQVVIMTPFGNAVSVACGLINSELQIGFDWLLQQYQAHRTKVTDQPLLVATTDADAAMRNAIRDCFPDVSLQLCKFHLNKNVALHISRKWKNRQAEQTQGDNQDQADEQDDRNEQPSDQESSQINSTATATQDRLSSEEAIQVSALNLMIHSLETGGQPQLPGLQNGTIEYSKAGVWAPWVVILTRSTEVDFLEAWETMMIVFFDQTELMKYFQGRIWPFREQWALCHTSQNLNFGQTTTSPVESLNKLLKSFAVSANTALDILIKQYFRMVCSFENKYDEQLRRNTTLLNRNYVQKPEFSQVKRKVAEQALNLANRQLIKLQRFVGGDLTVSLSSSITRNQGIISAKALFDRHKSERPVLQIEDFNPFWWLTRGEEDQDKYLAYNDPEKVDCLKGRPHNTERFRSDPSAVRVRVQKLPPSSAPSVATGILPSARRMPSYWETSDVLELSSRSATSMATTRGRKRPAPSTASGGAKRRGASSSVAGDVLN